MNMNILVPKIEVLHWKAPKHRIAIFLKMTLTIFIQSQEFMETTYLNKTVPVLLWEKNGTTSGGPNAESPIFSKMAQPVLIKFQSFIEAMDPNKFCRPKHLECNRIQTMNPRPGLNRNFFFSKTVLIEFCQSVVLTAAYGTLLVTFL